MGIDADASVRLTSRLTVLAKVILGYVIVWPLVVLMVSTILSPCAPPLHSLTTGDFAPRPCTFDLFKTNLSNWVHGLIAVPGAYMFMYAVLGILPALLVGSLSGAWQALRGHVSWRWTSGGIALAIVTLNYAAHPSSSSISGSIEPILICLVANLVCWRLTCHIVPRASILTSSSRRRRPLLPSP